MVEPSYARLAQTGELAERAQTLATLYEHCTLCPHLCGVNRTAGQQGRCGAGVLPVVASANAHFGEEPPISGDRGSGTVFLSHCTGSCLFCQNYPISQLGTGSEVTIPNLAEMMLSLQDRGCHNINVVTPTHYIPSIIQALAYASKRGLDVPLVYNSSGFESLETLRLLDGIVDIYLPDIKYADDAVAEEISGFQNYVSVNKAAIQEMYRQTGPLVLDDTGIARRGCIIRHLILPNELSGTEQCMRFLAESVATEIFVSLMDQYFPAYRATDHPFLRRKITVQEYDSAVDAFYSAGLNNGWVQNHYD